jgi:hypothetical protein
LSFSPVTTEQKELCAYPQELSCPPALTVRLEAIPIMGDAITQTIERFFDNSLENIGRGNSWTYLGPQWAQAATAPSRMYKSE